MVNSSNIYEITLNYIIPTPITLNENRSGGSGATGNGEIIQPDPYFQGRIIRLGISATGSTWNEALDNTLTAASQSAFKKSY